MIIYNCDFSNKLKKIIRKSIDVGEKVFKKERILSELSYIVVETLGNIYPELQNNIKKVLYNKIEYEYLYYYINKFKIYFLAYLISYYII